VKLDIIAQNQWLGDNFNAFQQDYADFSADPRALPIVPLPSS
jgi:hypothetical protein